MKPADKPEALNEYALAIRFPIHWGDQDALGHVNNTVPIRWFESARIAYMDHCRIGDLLREVGLGPILASTACNYRRQLHYPDNVFVGARVTRIGGSSLTMEYAVFSEKLDAIAVDGSASIVAFNYAKNRPARVPRAMRLVVEQFEGREFPRKG